MSVKQLIDDVFESYNVSPNTEDEIKAELECELHDYVNSEVTEVLAQIEWEHQTGLGDPFTVEEILARLKSEFC